MRPSIRVHHLLAGLGLALLVGGMAACGDDPPDNDGDDDCSIGDPIEGPTCECDGASCVCPSSGDCGILCLTACDLQCAGSGSCDFVCSDDCDAACTGSGNCDVTVGASSHVACTGSGDCDVTCVGDCTVSCPGSGTCTIYCEPGVLCDFETCSGSAEDCGGGVQVCNGNCPG